MLHKNGTTGDIHIAHNWEVADAAARLALIVSASDIGKICYQLVPEDYFILKVTGWAPLTSTDTSTAKTFRAQDKLLAASRNAVAAVYSFKNF